jgi:hypothetical protein
MIGRRALLVAAAASAVARPADAALPVPQGDALAFRMIRRGGEIGRHTLAFERQGEALTVRIAIDAVVTLLAIPVYRYRHRGVETWQGGTLVGITGETNKNGEPAWVKASRGAEGLVVTGSKTARYVAPEGAMATSYWNRRMLDGPMINLEDGALLRPKIEVRRGEQVRLAAGGMVPADHYTLSGAFDVEIWYDPSDTWAGLAFAGSDGSSVRYERL